MNFRSASRKARFSVSAMVLLAVFTAMAQEIDNIKGPVCVLRDSVTKTTFTLSPLKSTYNILVTDGLAQIELTQVYVNTFGRTSDIVYVFPLPHDGAVNAMSMMHKNQLYTAKIVEKQAAIQKYDSVVRTGGTGALTLQERPNIFQQHLANIGFGDTAVVKIGVSMPLKYLNGVYELAVPTMIGERYQSAGQTFVPSGPFWNPPENRDGQSLQVNVILMTGFPVTRIESPTHPLLTDGVAAMKKTLLDRGVLTDSLVISEPYASGIVLLSQSTYPNRDFVLHFSRVESKQDFNLSSYYDSARKEGYFAMNIFPDTALFSGSRPNLDIVLLVDQSGSQMGWPLEAEKRVTLEILSRLLPTDRLNVLSFSDNVYWAFGGAVSVEATAANIATASLFVNALTPLGGTQLLSGVQAALATTQNAGYERYYIFLTDGFITNETAILDAIKNHPSKPTVFTFGCGNSVNRYLIDGAAATGNGGYGTVITENDARESVVPFVDAAWNMIATPQIKNVTIDFGTCGASGVMMPGGANLFVGRPIEVYGRYENGGPSIVTVKGIQGTKEITLQKSVVFASAANMNVMVPKIWARQYIGYLSLQEGATTINKSAIIEVSTAFQVLSKYTAFLAISPEKLQGSQGGAVEISRPARLSRLLTSGTSMTAFMQNGSLWISLPGQAVVKKMTVFDLRGRVLFTCNFANTTPLARVSWNGRLAAGRRLNPGNYLVSLDTAEGVMVTSFAWK